MNKQTKSRIRPLNTENKQMLARGKGWEGGTHRKGVWEIEVSSYGVSHRNKRHSIRNMGSDTVITLYGDRW